MGASENGSLKLDLTCHSIHTAQFIGAPLYFVNKDYYYAWMAMTKQYFGILVNSITQWFCPTVVRVSGDDSVQGELKLTKDGRLETAFPERLVLIANHQVPSTITPLHAHL